MNQSGVAGQFRSECGVPTQRSSAAGPGRPVPLPHHPGECLVSPHRRGWGARAAIPPLFRMGWQADYPDPDNPLRLGPRTHWVGWASDVYVDLLEQARRITDHGERIAVYQRADRLLIEEAVILPIVYGRQHWLVKPWVRQFSPSALYWTFWGNVIIESH